MKFQQGEVPSTSSYVPAFMWEEWRNTLLAKERLAFEIITYYVVRWSYVKLLMKLSDGVSVMFIKLIVLGKYAVS